MTTIAFKPVNLALDAKTCVEYRADSFVVSFGDDKKFYEADRLGDRRYLEWLGAKIAKDPLSVIHVWSDDLIIGQIELGILRDDPTCGYVNLYYLAPHYRGRGIGTLLDEHAMNYFRNLGLARARLSVSPSNKIALSFYQKLGWVDLGPRTDHPEVHFMEKLLA